MKALAFATLLMALAATAAAAQQSRPDSPRHGVAGGEVALRKPAEPNRLAIRIPGIEDAWQRRVTVGGDSAQRIAMADFEWRGRVSSVEIDEEDARVFWDVKIVPDSADRTILRYRIDAGTGGILGIRVFTGIQGLARRP